MLNVEKMVAWCKHSQTKAIPHPQPLRFRYTLCPRGEVVDEEVSPGRVQVQMPPLEKDASACWYH